ncbi:MAG: excinuclease ABC subunit UvrA [Clostridia bacterium]|nr:excinuclease ABC subunit UvrA [Clostridia bacterium]
MENIIIKGAKENNLKNVNLTIPRNKLVVFSGVSGSGKSTLAFDTICAEGQRKFLESLSSYARQFLGQAQKPNVESIEGLSPSISIDQKTTNNNPRSTVGTVTEIYDYIRLLYSRIGVPHCPKCGKEISQQTLDDIVNKVLSFESGTKLMINAPIVRGDKGSFVKDLQALQKQGFVRVKVDGSIYRLDEEINLDKNKKHHISVVVDRLVVGSDIKSRLTESIETALNLADGLVVVDVDGDEMLYSTKYACNDCDISIEEITPRLFSFNSPFGACDKCLGLGFTQSIDPMLILKNADKTINEGALALSGWTLENGSVSEMYFKALSKKYNFSLDVPLKDLPKDIVDILLYGNNGEQLELEYTNKKFSGSYSGSYEGIINNLERRFRETQSEMVKREISRYIKEAPCTKCKGKRLNANALSVTIGGLNIYQICEQSIEKFNDFLMNLKLDEEQAQIAEPILKEIVARNTFLLDVGLGYLTLSRMAGTLSGGESQRIRLATQIGSGLTGVLYVLDEPSIGLHQRDNDKLLATMLKLRDLGNTLIVVEHDEDTIRSADFIVDIGPFAGDKGGNVVASGSLKDILNEKQSITGQYLSGAKKIEVPKQRREGKGWFSVKGAKQNNLKNVDAKFKVGGLNVITGVSGSGKSSLITEVVYPYLSNELNRTDLMVGKCQGVNGIEQFDKVIEIDQSPIGRTPRSNPATYTGVFTAIRELFASTVGAKERGYNASRFSFNVKGGRCERCEGDGVKKIEMYFLPDIYVPCSLCGGKRYNSETLEVKYKDKTIYDVLEMTVEDALTFFENIPSIRNKLQTIYDVGLGYIKLGQPATTLSGGEAQRVKLATELSRRSTGKTIYILDEPTTGLHTYDVSKLVDILDRLVDSGNTVLVIEHNLDVIKRADFIVDLGPEGGDGGGQVVISGTPEEVAKCEKSYTGKYLKRYLSN